MSRYALVIGIENYEDPRLNNLSKAVGDAEAIAELLEKYGDCPRNQITLLTDKTTGTGKVTTEDLIRALKNFLQGKRGDRIIYFSGHGVLEEKKHTFKNKVEKQGHLAAYDCKIQEKDPQVIQIEEGLKLADLADLMGESQVSNLIAIFDACHSGSLIEEIKNKFTNFSSETNYYFLAACQSWEESWSKKADKYSQFTQALINALSEKEIDKNNGIITISQAFEKAEKEMESLGALSSNQGRQKPIALGMGGRLEIVKHYPTAQLLGVSHPHQEQLSLEQLAILKNILEPIDRDLLRWVLLESISYIALDTWLDNDESMGLDGFLNTIEEKFPQLADQSRSLFKVIALLAGHPQIEFLTKTQLENWLNNFSKTPEELNGSLKPYLMAVIEQTRPNEPFKLVAFLKIEDKPVIPIRLRKVTSDKPYQQNPQNAYLCTCPKWENILDWVKDIIETSEDVYLKGYPCPYELNVELFLPFDYLTKTIDLWKIREQGRMAYKLGQQYPFIVRSSERITKGWYSNKLQTMWAKINNSLQIDFLSQIKQLHQLERSSIDYCSQLENELNELMDNPMFGLTCYLPQDDIMLFEVVLETGIPLALWSRPNQCQCQFDRLLNNQIKEPEDLIKAVFKQRQKAHQPRYRNNPEAQWGYHLAMLFDNPKRTPPSQYLQSPGS